MWNTDINIDCVWIISVIVCVRVLCVCVNCLCVFNKTYRSPYYQLPQNATPSLASLSNLHNCRATSTHWNLHPPHETHTTQQCRDKWPPTLPPPQASCPPAAFSISCWCRLSHFGLPTGSCPVVTWSNWPQRFPVPMVCQSLVVWCRSWDRLIVSFVCVWVCVCVFYRSFKGGFKVWIPF